MFKIVNIFFYFAITFFFGIQVLTLIWTELDSFYLKKNIQIRVNFGWILPRFWRKDMKILALHTFIPIVSRKFAKRTRLFAKVTRKFAKVSRYSRKFRVYSRKFRSNTRKVRVNSRKFREKYNFFLRKWAQWAFGVKGGDLLILFFISTKLIQNIDKHFRPILSKLGIKRRHLNLFRWSFPMGDNLTATLTIFKKLFSPEPTSNQNWHKAPYRKGSSRLL